MDNDSDKEVSDHEAEEENRKRSSSSESCIVKADESMADKEVIALNNNSAPTTLECGFCGKNDSSEKNELSSSDSMEKKEEDDKDDGEAVTHTPNVDLLELTSPSWLKKDKRSRTIIFDRAKSVSDSETVVQRSISRNEKNSEKLVLVKSDSEHENESKEKCFSTFQGLEGHSSIHEQKKNTENVDEQLEVEVQKHLQLRLEAQEKYMQMILEKSYQTLAGENMASAATNIKGTIGRHQENHSCGSADEACQSTGRKGLED